MRLLHTMLRVGNLEASIQFYTEIMNMKLLRKKIIPMAVLLWLLLVMVMNLKTQLLN